MSVLISYNVSIEIFFCTPYGRGHWTASRGCEHRIDSCKDNNTTPLSTAPS